MRGKYYLRETGSEVQEAITDVRNKTIYDPATRTADGLMSKEDKIKIDDLAGAEELSLEEIENILKD